MASVKVAVRVRPFNQREIDLDSRLVIQMEGKKTKILNSSKLVGNRDVGVKEFTFDHSYWSFDCNDKEFAAQDQVFNDLGTEVVDSAFQGYNACVFAYGQTGSGKTFTMMGSPENQGLIPRICKSMFERMHVGKEGGASYRTEVSYLEIYNEKVKDLLQSNSSHSLRVREHPSMGPYVQSLSTHLVSDYSDIQEWMKRGNVHRTTARTNMNDTSSRSHAIFTITFVQAEFSRYHPTETVSKIHLVDLAGSERADATGATGERLKEGAHINKSLVTLGLVISSLAKLSSNPNDPAAKRNSTFIPYRDSVLTWLLKDSLGGNSKTIMIAAISPADVNYEETLSTLRYANRAKNIINKPTINEDPNVTLIRTLREEIDKLKNMLGGQHSNQPEQSVLAQLQQKEAREKALTEEWTEKWRETRQILEEQSALGLRKSGVGIILDSDRPHLVGIDDDLLSTGVTFYHLKDGETLIGTDESSIKQDIELTGGGIIPEHCSVVLQHGQSWLHPRPNAPCWVNTAPVDKPVRLSQGCIILLGRNNMFRFNDPAEAAALRKTGSRSHLNLSTLSLVYSSTTDLAERTFSNDNLLDETGFDDREISEMIQSSPKDRQSSKEEESTLNGAKKILKEERNALEAGYQAEKEKLVADWEQLQKRHNERVAVVALKEAELDERKAFIEKVIHAESLKIEVISKELENLEKLKLEKQKSFEDMISQQMETLKQTNETVASTFSNELADAGTSPDLVALLTQFISSIPESESQFKNFILKSMEQYKADMCSIQEELNSKSSSLKEGYNHMSSLSSELNNLVKKVTSSDSVTESEMNKLEHTPNSDNESINLRERKEALTLPLQNISSDQNLNDSGIGSGQTDRSLSDPLSPLSTNISTGLKRRNRGSDSSEEELICRQRGKFVRTKQLSKSCRAIYDEVGVGEAMRAMKSLCQKVTAQKLLIMQSLENDCSKEEINIQIAELQDLHRQYVRLEAVLELRRENVLLRMQENRRYSQLNMVSPPSSGQSDDGSPRFNPMARSMPSLRCPSEDWDSWVRIPSFVLRGVGRQARYDYEIRMFTNGEMWTLMRRYRSFRELHLSTCNKYGKQIEVLNFPPRHWLPFNFESVARKRRALLETYLQQLIDICSRIRGCPLYGCGDQPERQALQQFSPFFKKGLFEPGKYGTS